MRLQLHQVEEMDTSIFYMDRKLFKAAKDGDMELLFNKYKGSLDRLVDGEQNTALHIYSTSGGREVTIIRKLRRSLFCLSTRFEIRREESMEYLEQLLDRCPRLLRQANAKGEIPLHVAARHGRRKIVEFLIKRSKEQNVDLEQMVRMKDKDHNTALHMAVQFDDNLQVVRLLLKEDPNYLSNSVDTRGITPIYLAARRGFFGSVDEILDYCQPRALVGPHGRTILHAAALANSEQTVKIILKREKHLTKQGDEDGRTPLHYAALSGYISVAKALLESYDGSAAAYLTDKEKGMTALHIAALQSDIAMMKCIISHCPGCTGIVDRRGWNFLHFAFLTLHHARDISRDDLINYRFIRNFLYDKDVDGITPSHVSRYGPNISFEISHPVWDENSSQVADNKTKIEQVLNEICKIEVAGLPVRDFNDIPAATDVSYKRTDEKIRHTHLLVATLVATVTFTAAFTVPGGYKSEQGTAMLSRNAAFKVFIITDSLAFVSSLSAVWIHILMVYLERNTNSNINRLLHYVVDPLTGLGMMAMAIAFSTGLYAVLGSSLGLAIAACSIGTSFFLIIFFAYYKSCRVYGVYEHWKRGFTDCKKWICCM